MIRHTVLFTWADGVTDAQVDAMAVELNARVATLPTIAAYKHGADLGLSDGNADYAIVAEFASADDYVEYRDHPDHVAVIAESIKPLIAQRMAVQYQID
ncbi:MAG: Dabb family protein [Ilumatobacter sp.]